MLQYMLVIAKRTNGGLLLAALLLCMLTFPLLVRAEDPLSATIRAAILSDPRASGLAPSQIDSLVSALSARAQAQGLTAHEIAWQPSAIAVLQDAQSDTPLAGGLLLALFLSSMAALTVTAMVMEHLKGRPLP